jgi:hypothetical protein
VRAEGGDGGGRGMRPREGQRWWRGGGGGGDRGEK